MKSNLSLLLILLAFASFSQEAKVDSTITEKKETVVAKSQPKKTESNKSLVKGDSNKPSSSGTPKQNMPKQKATKEAEEDPSIKGQFEKIYRISTTYQTYKVIGIDRFQNLKRNVLDSLKKSNEEIRDKEKQLKKEQETISDLNSQLEKTQSDLNIALTKENSISLFGVNLNKTTYNLILWSLIVVLGALSTYFVIRFSRSNILTKKAQENLKDVEDEFEIHRKKSLEREQKLRRELQDEINKQRGV